MAGESNIPSFIGPISWQPLQLGSMSTSSSGQQSQTKPELPVGTPGNLLGYGMVDENLDQLERSVYMQAQSSYAKSGLPFRKWLQKPEAQELLKTKFNIAQERSKQEWWLGVMKSNKELADKYIEAARPYLNQYIQGEKPGDVEFLQPGDEGYDPSKPKIKTLGQEIKREYALNTFYDVGGIPVPQPMTQRQVYQLEKNGTPVYQEALRNIFAKESLGSNTVADGSQGSLGTQYAGIGLLQNDESTTETNIDQIRAAISVIKEKLGDTELRSAYQDFYEQGLGVQPIKVKVADPSDRSGKKSIEKTLNTREEQFDWWLEMKARAAATGKEEYKRKPSFQYIDIPGFKEKQAMDYEHNKNMQWNYWHQIATGSNGVQYKPYDMTGYLNAPMAQQTEYDADNNIKRVVPVLGKTDNAGGITYDFDDNGIYRGSSKYIQNAILTSDRLKLASNAYSTSNDKIKGVPRGEFYAKYFGDLISKVPTFGKMIGIEMAQDLVRTRNQPGEVIDPDEGIKTSYIDRTKSFSAAVGAHNSGIYAWTMKIANVPNNPYNNKANQAKENQYIGTDLNNGSPFIIAGNKVTHFTGNLAKIIDVDQVAYGVPYPDQNTKYWVRVGVLCTKADAKQLEVNEEFYNPDKLDIDSKTTTAWKSDRDYSISRLSSDALDDIVKQYGITKDMMRTGKYRIIYGWIPGGNIVQNAMTEDGFKYTFQDQQNDLERQYQQSSQVQPTLDASGNAILNNQGTGTTVPNK